MIAAAAVAAHEAAIAPFKRVGNYVTFGTYPQSEEGTDSTAIEWKVLDVQGDKALLISHYSLDCQQYNTSYASVTWESCTLRTWLNSTFLNKAFNSEEQKAIVTTIVDNSKSQCDGFRSAEGSNNTADKIFLLSFAEVGKYFSSDKSLMSAPTDYAWKRGVFRNSTYKTDDRPSGQWWLRSPGTSNWEAITIWVSGGYGSAGTKVD